ncbi:MAG: hypothetical protein C5B57_03755 [Blastocatellia bacterium]|nr:MAG: hypothetical protein C5B57_03755 [Blastocatellia bacterium]
MSDTPPLTATRLWKNMNPAQRLTAAEAFWRDEEIADDQMQAVMLIAQQKKFRPKSVVALDAARKARHLASITNLPAGLAARALIVFHLADRRPMMSAFLDALEIPHENGLIQSEAATPDASKLAAAVAKLNQEYPAADVSLYLNTLLCQDPATWGGLADLVQAGNSQP